LLHELHITSMWLSITFAYRNLESSQELASLTYLQPHIDAIHAKASALDVPTSVIDPLHELFNVALILCVSPFNLSMAERAFE
jgi:hypothetical protein